MSKTGFIICAFTRVSTSISFYKCVYHSFDNFNQTHRPFLFFPHLEVRTQIWQLFSWKLLKIALCCSIRARVMVWCHNYESVDVRSWCVCELWQDSPHPLLHFCISQASLSDAVVLMVGGIPRSFSSSLYLLHQTLIITDESPAVMFATFTANCLCISWSIHVFTCVRERFSVRMSNS